MRKVLSVYLDVEARGEGAPGAREHDDADFGIVGEGLEDFAQVEPHAYRPTVSLRS